MNNARAHRLNNNEIKAGTVVYWMSRDQRADDNWGLICAQSVALETKSALAVVFSLAPNYEGSSIRRYSIMLESLKETSKSLALNNIPFFLLGGSPISEIPKFIEWIKAGAVICDFDPLKTKRHWFDGVAGQLSCAMIEVDSHNIVPARLASPKREWGAYTFRPKIHRVLHEYLDEFPNIIKHPFDLVNFTYPHALKIDKIDDKYLLKNKYCAEYPAKIETFESGAKAANETLANFIENKIENYSSLRNNFMQDWQSGLSPYLHLGIISPQRVALEVRKSDISPELKNAFLEELIVRRELSDNFCLYCEDYDNVNCAIYWAKETIEKHKNDERPLTYTLEELENAATHDDIWNMIQRQAIETGKPHGYLRMYWAKKILEWSPTYEEAFANAIYLNDKYFLDGCDPNGYAAIAWSLAGVHDRAWGEREIFGKIRYMSYDSIKSKMKSFSV